jgi:hypothetical protein
MKDAIIHDRDPDYVYPGDSDWIGIQCRVCRINFHIHDVTRCENIYETKECPYRLSRKLRLVSP